MTEEVFKYMLIPISPDSKIVALTIWLLYKKIWLLDFPGGSDSKASANNAGHPGSIPGLGRFPGEGNGNPLLKKSHGQRILVGYSPWGRKELDTTERLHFLSFYTRKYRNRLYYLVSSVSLP